MTEAAGLGPSGHPSVWRPRSLAFPPSPLPGGGATLAPPFPFSPWHLGQGRLGLGHLSDAWGARGEESWHCSHKTYIM